MLKMIKLQNPDKEYPSALGMKWSDDEENQLLEELSNHLSIHDISIKHNRTIGGITSRIHHIAYKMYTSNISITEISEKTKLDDKQIMNIVNKKDKNNKSTHNIIIEKPSTNIFDFLEDYNTNHNLLNQDNNILYKKEFIHKIESAKNIIITCNELLFHCNNVLRDFNTVLNESNNFIEQLNNEDDVDINEDYNDKNKLIHIFDNYSIIIQTLYFTTQFEPYDVKYLKLNKDKNIENKYNYEENDYFKDFNEKNGKYIKLRPENIKYNDYKYEDTNNHFFYIAYFLKYIKNGITSKLYISEDKNSYIIYNFSEKKFIIKNQNSTFHLDNTQSEEFINILQLYIDYYIKKFKK